MFLPRFFFWQLHSCLWSIWSERWKNQEGERLELKIVRYVFLFLKRWKKIIYYFQIWSYIYIFFFTIINREIHSVELPQVVATTRKKCVSVLTWQSPARRNADVSFNSEMASGQTSTGKEEKPKHHTDTIAPLFIIESHPDLKRPLQRQR